VTISEHINDLMLAAIHYRNRQLIFRFVMSEHNRAKYLKAGSELEQQKKRLLTAISKGAYIN